MCMLTTLWWYIPQNLKDISVTFIIKSNTSIPEAVGLYMLISSAVLMVWLFVWPWAGGTAQRDRQCLHTNPAGAAETGSPAQTKRFHYLHKTGGGGDRSIRKELHMWLIGSPDAAIHGRLHFGNATLQLTWKWYTVQRPDSVTALQIKGRNRQPALQTKLVSKLAALHLRAKSFWTAARSRLLFANLQKKKRYSEKNIKVICFCREKSLVVSSAVHMTLPTETNHTSVQQRLKCCSFTAKWSRVKRIPICTPASKTMKGEPQPHDRWSKRHPLQDPELLQRPNKFCISKYIYTGITVVRRIHHALENWTLILTHGRPKRVKICVRLKQMTHNQKDESIAGHIFTLWSLTYWNIYNNKCLLFICWISYLIYQVCMAHIVWYSENILFRGPNWAKMWNLVQFLIFLMAIKKMKFW